MRSNIGLILEVYIYYERKVQGGEYGRRLCEISGKKDFGGGYDDFHLRNINFSSLCLLL